MTLITSIDSVEKQGQLACLWDPDLTAHEHCGNTGLPKVSGDEDHAQLLLLDWTLSELRYEGVFLKGLLHVTFESDCALLDLVYVCWKCY